MLKKSTEYRQNDQFDNSLNFKDLFNKVKSLRKFGNAPKYEEQIFSLFNMNRKPNDFFDNMAKHNERYIYTYICIFLI